MQWQKLDNIDPKPNHQILMIYWCGKGGLKFVDFVRRFTNEHGVDSLQISDDYNTVLHFPNGGYQMTLKNYKKTHPNAYWCVFHEPDGE